MVAAATGSPLMMQLFAAEDMSGASIAALVITTYRKKWRGLMRAEEA